MGFFDKLKGKSSSKDNPPDFSSFDNELTKQGSLPDESGFDQSFNSTNPDNMLESSFEQDTQGTDFGMQVRTQPSQPKTPGTQGYQQQQNNSNFNHDMFQQQSNNNSNDQVVYQEISHRQADLILERLDTVKAELDSVKQRLKHIELLVDHRDKLNTQKRYL